ncbi:hypothetical protein [Corynebacterium lubricantis]|uniref:hypothetical protein n=1 Tax=Corynebacterium lubricantis TaxID=541095 RepID=UPI00037C951F|nr:hypothetical protein [Corynebacterium lubricantis]
MTSLRSPRLPSIDAVTVVLIAWATLLVGAVTWPLFGPGEFALRDMVILERPYLTHASLGFGDVPGRNVPQDGVLALFATIIPATWVVRLLMVASAALSALGAAKLAGPGAWAKAAAMAIAVANPYVIERLLQGQWSLVIAAWLLPLIAAAGLRGRTGLQIVLLWIASLTPTGAIVATATAFCTNRKPILLLAGAFSSAPWIVTGLMHSSAGRSAAVGAEVFAPRAEGYVGTLGALLGLGGIWNGDAVPASREAGFALFGVALFAVLAIAYRRIPRPLLLLAAVGFAIACVSWLAPGVMGQLIEHVPGAGLLRDGQKWLILAIPAYVSAAGALKPILAALALALSLLQTPDAPVALEELRPVHIAVPEVDHQGRDVYFIDRPSLIERSDGIPVVDPATKAMNVVESGGLTVDGQVVDQDSPRYLDGLSDPQAHGIGLIVSPDGHVEDTGAPAQPREPLGLALLAVWFLTPLLAVRFKRR